MENWRRDLETWLAPFVAGLRHKTRGRICPAYVAGLIGPGDRKSVQPMAARDGAVSYDQLHHFVASEAWDSAPLEAALLAEADRLVGGEASWLIIDDTCLPKKGDRSVGVAAQYASSLGKTANCQSLVSVTLASREVPVMVGLRLFLPESWTDDPGRMARARVPEDRQAALSKPEIAIEEIDRVRAAGLRFGCVLADAGYGSSGPFRQALSARGLNWAVGLSRRQNVYPAGTELIFPEASTGRRRKYHIPDRMALSAETMLENETWQKVSWRQGTKGRLSCQFAAARVRIADGHKHRMGDGRVQAVPGDEEVWLIGERRRTEILRFQLAERHHAQGACRRCQSQMDLRTGASATQGGTRPRPFRGTLLDRPAPTCADDNDRLRLSAIPPPQSRGTKKKGCQDHRLNPPCQPSGKRYSTSSRDRHPCAVHTMTDRSTQNFRHDLPK